ncbi:MAG: MFS transporter, partial [Candidatus Nanopelagicales bacterium]
AVFQLKSVAETRTFRSLRHRNYKLFFSANLFSNVGTWMQRIAQDWLVLELTGSGTVLGIVTALQFLPALFLSLPSGKLADRRNKRKLLILTNTIAGTSALILGLLVITELIQVWHVIVLAIMLGISSAVDAPIRQSFVPELVGKEDLPNAIGLNSANFNAGRLVGPAIAGIIIAAVGTGPAFIINALTYPVVIGALTLMNPTTLHKFDRANKRDGVRSALRYVKNRADLIAVMTLVLIVGAFGFNFQVVTALMARVEFNVGANGFGLFGTMIAVGTVTGAVTLARAKESPRLDFILKAAIAFGLIEILAAQMPTYWMFAGVLPLAGFAAMMVMANANAYVQSSVPDHLRGRVLGLYLMVFLGGSPLGSPIIGKISQDLGARYGLSIGGFISAAAALIILLWVRKRTVARDSKVEAQSD